jgi:homoserine kinase
MEQITVSVPATTANLGPGFDCLGLALDLWNRTTFRLDGRGVRVSVAGEGAGTLPRDQSNLIVRAFERSCLEAGRDVPAGLELICENAIPLGSGLGSSAAAVVTGVAGANALLELGLSPAGIVRIAAEIEGHPDNAAAAVYGGLVIATGEELRVIVHAVQVQPLPAVIVLPDYHLPTREARGALPRLVALADAVANIGRTALVVEALRSGDRELLYQAMSDRLHQPYRLPLIPGAQDALQLAWQQGIPAALSGAGPALIAFPGAGAEEVINGMRTAFSAAGLESRSWVLGISTDGMQIT